MWIALVIFGLPLLGANSPPANRAKEAAKGAGGIGLFWLAVVLLVAFAAAGR